MLASRYVATGPGHGVQLASGRLLVCCDHATSADPKSRHIPGASTAIRSHAMLSDDFGSSWRVSNSLEDGDECSIAPLANGSLLMEMRQSTVANSSVYKRRQFAVSHTQGSSWSAPSTAPFPFVGGSNDCEASMVRLPGSARLIMSAPHHMNGRQNMSLFVSDTGESWRALRQVDPGASGYSSLAAVNSSAADLAWESSGSVRFATVQL